MFEARTGRNFIFENCTGSELRIAPAGCFVPLYSYSAAHFIVLLYCETITATFSICRGLIPNTMGYSYGKQNNYSKQSQLNLT